MEILGIGPGEFVLILIVLLVVVGPERLPGLARSAGQFLVRARNWLQTSPDAALVMRARQEIEAELASIKNSLMEVQVVRDEVLGAAKQFEDSVGSIAPPKFDINSLVNSPAEPTIAANGQAISGGESPALLMPEGTPLDQRSTLELPNGSSAPIDPPAEAQHTNGFHGSAEAKPAVAAAAAPALGELESINIRLQAIMADMWALQQQLKQRGALDETWQPPSLDVQLPTPETAAPADPLSQAEPIEDQAVLAARERLEEHTPMQVAYHAPPVIEEAPADSTAGAVVIAEAEVVAADTSATETSAEHAALIDPLAAPAPKARKRRASSTAEQGLVTTAETPVESAPVIKTRKRRAAATTEPIQETADTPADSAPAKARKRRTPAASPSMGRDSAERSDETEPITTEKAS